MDCKSIAKIWRKCSVGHVKTGKTSLKYLHILYIKVLIEHISLMLYIRVYQSQH